MNRAQCSDHGPFFDGHMPAQRSGIGQNHVIANHAIVRHMGIGHDQRMAADSRYSAAFYRAPVQSHELADNIIIADFEPRRFAFVAQILRVKLNRRKRKKTIASAYS